MMMVGVWGSDAVVQRASTVGRDVCERRPSEHAATVPLSGAEIERKLAIGDCSDVEPR